MYLLPAGKCSRWTAHPFPFFGFDSNVRRNIVSKINTFIYKILKALSVVFLFALLFKPMTPQCNSLTRKVIFPRGKLHLMKTTQCTKRNFPTFRNTKKLRMTNRQGQKQLGHFIPVLGKCLCVRSEQNVDQIESQTFSMLSQASSSPGRAMLKLHL